MWFLWTSPTVVWYYMKKRHTFLQCISTIASFYDIFFSISISNLYDTESYRNILISRLCGGPIGPGYYCTIWLSSSDAWPHSLPNHSPPITFGFALTRNFRASMKYWVKYRALRFFVNYFRKSFSCWSIYFLSDLPPRAFEQIYGFVYFQKKTIKKQ